MFGEAGTEFSPVTMSHPSLRTTALPCLPLGIKASLKDEAKIFALGAFGFWLFDVGGFGREKNC
jgi:hypothetical protein